MDRMINWLLVGAGDIARKRVAPALVGVAGSRIAAICDSDENRAADLARDFGNGRVFTDYPRALAESGADAVYLATPVGLHVPMAFAANAAGKHVLVEKPLGLSHADALPAVKMEARSPLACGCAYFRRFYPAYLHAKEMLARGEFGKIVHVRMAYYSWFNPSTDDPKYWRVIRAKSGGGSLSDMGTHMFDVLIGLFGLPERVSAATVTLDRDWDVEDSAGMVMRLKNGALASAEFHWNSKTWSHVFEIVGTEARVVWNPFDGGKALRTIGRETVELDFPNAANVHQPLVEDFVSAIRKGVLPR